MVALKQKLHEVILSQALDINLLTHIQEVNDQLEVQRMIFILSAIYLYFGHFYLKYPVIDLFTSDVFYYLTKSIFTLSWLWKNSNLFDLFMIGGIYAVLTFCWYLIITAISIIAAYKDYKEDY